MKKTELISIIIPVYKVEDCIDKCIKSLLSQTYKNIEIILVDDGSPDNSGKICDEWAKKDNRIKVIHKENSGVSSTRNIGIAEATGTYIAFVDSDDWLEENAVETLYNKLIVEDVDMVRCNYFINTNKKEAIAPMSSVIKINEKILTATNYFKEEVLSSFLSGNIPGYIWLFLIRKDVIVNSNPFKEDITLAEDLIFLVDVFSKAKSMYFFDTPLYHYYINENGLTRSSAYYQRNIKNVPKLTKYLEEAINRDWNNTKLVDIRKAASAKMIMSYVYALYKQTQKEEFKLILSQIMDDKDVCELLKSSDLKLLDQGIKKYIEIIFMKLIVRKKYNLLCLLYWLRRKLKF